MIENCNILLNKVSHDCLPKQSTYANETQLLFLTNGLIGNNFNHSYKLKDHDKDENMKYIFSENETACLVNNIESYHLKNDIENEAATVIQKAYRLYKSRQNKNFILSDWKNKYLKPNTTVDQEDPDSMNYIEFWDKSEGQRSPYSLITNSNSITDSKGSDIDIENSGIDDSYHVEEQNIETNIAQVEQDENFINEHIYDSIPLDISANTPQGSPQKIDVPRMLLRNHHSECPLSKRKYSDELNHYPEINNAYRYNEQNSVFVREEDLLNKTNSNLYVVRSQNSQPIVMTISDNCPSHRIIHNNVSISPKIHTRNVIGHNQCSLLVNECRVIRSQHEPLTRNAISRESRISQIQKVVYQKRMYRVGLNLFNKNPVVGVNYLIKNQFVKSHPSHIAKFFLTKNGISRSAVGDYLGLLSDPLALQVTKYFLRRINMKNKEVDEALRSFIYYVHLPGESQKISHLMEQFKEAYVHQNEKHHFRSADTIMVLGYAIIMLQTDAHNLSIKKNEKMTLEQFVNNLRGVDENHDIDRNVLEPIYARVTGKELKTMPDHTDQVRHLNDIISGPNKPFDLLNRVRRFMCYCRLLEIIDDGKKNKSAAHQREVFLFNDLLMITKLQNKSRKDDQYQCRYALPLVDIQVKQFRTTNYEFGIHLLKKKSNESIIKLNALCQLDQRKFFFDLNDCIFESLEMCKTNQTESSSTTPKSQSEVNSPKVTQNNNVSIQKSNSNVQQYKVHNNTPNPPRRQESLIKHENPVLKSMYQVRNQIYVDSNVSRQIHCSKPFSNNYL